MLGKDEKRIKAESKAFVKVKQFLQNGSKRLEGSCKKRNKKEYRKVNPTEIKKMWKILRRPLFQNLIWRTEFLPPLSASALPAY